MRFIFNFFFYGILFYLIWRFLPETFDTLVAWMNSIYVVLQDVVLWGLDFVRALIAK